MATDLFGEPVTASRGPGRPRYVPTDRDRATVALLHAAGRTHLEIAAAIGISHPTLLLNYPLELESSSQSGRRREQRDQAKGES
ncbi:helix-turn-helix domain-containing protein [Erythrobacter sp. A6_0]|uniref:helix-turn-helix domain-containing protein n=1 Tax=Erythrobacter sp. A6_0 TaxID=2821089 RepID=UPI001ADC3BF0|nr:helix-turn-helix domain-containing protein [Erythrobacter sp. A6_0]MBO9510928.1 helix-turn-helix domain-containing protein [Erythrobacter sp. A6_0]